MPYHLVRVKSELLLVGLFGFHFVFIWKSSGWFHFQKDRLDLASIFLLHNSIVDIKDSPSAMSDSILNESNSLCNSSINGRFCGSWSQDRANISLIDKSETFSRSGRSVVIFILVKEVSPMAYKANGHSKDHTSQHVIPKANTSVF